MICAGRDKEIVFDIRNNVLRFKRLEDAIHRTAQLNVHLGTRVDIYSLDEAVCHTDARIQ